MAGVLGHVLSKIEEKIRCKPMSAVLPKSISLIELRTLE